MKAKLWILVGLVLAVFISGCTEPPQLVEPIGKFEVQTNKTVYSENEEIEIEFSSEGSSPVTYIDPFQEGCSTKHTYFKVLKLETGLDGKTYFKETAFPAPDCLGGTGSYEKLLPGEKNTAKWKIPDAGTYKLEFTYFIDTPAPQPGEIVLPYERPFKAETNEFQIVASGSEINARLDDEFQLKATQTAVIENEGLKIKFLDVTEDSRCATEDAQGNTRAVCVWEGQVAIVVNVSKNNQNLGDFTLVSRAGHDYLGAESFGDYSIKLVKVDPYPLIGQETGPADYVAKFVVSKEGRWVSILPVIYGLNAWQKWYEEGGKTGLGELKEAEMIRAYFSEEHKIDILGYESVSLDKKEICPNDAIPGDCALRGDKIIVKVGAENVQKMVELGWKAELLWVYFDPIQCAMNPWEVWGNNNAENNPLICFEKPDGTSVASGNCNSCSCDGGAAVCTEIACGAPTENKLIKLYYEGVQNVDILLYENIPAAPGTVVCLACNCGRGDTIKVLVGEKDAEKMMELGWKTGK